jgi:predicted N-acetyltransferase YhbS
VTAPPGEARVRPEVPADVTVTRDVVAAVFGDEPVAGLLDAMRRSPAWLDLSYVAEESGAVVGPVSFMFHPLGLSTGRRETTFQTWLG